ncbi:MAG: FadR family transcriptional regulator, partial [Deltaproteobacteria bacterium]|nr:FadR family transcriptional regulator [Deltaproteobacteria bacterium]
MLQKVRKIRLSDMIVNQIKDLILTKQATPGMCLGSEREMCKKLNVSRSVLREALSNLQAQGLIRSDPQGVFVESITPNSMKEPIENVLKEDKEKIFELNEVRRILESGMIALAIERATPDDIEKIKESLAALEESYTNGQLGDEENVQFHLRLAESCHNSIYI